MDGLYVEGSSVKFHDVVSDAPYESLMADGNGKVWLKRKLSDEE